MRYLAVAALIVAIILPGCGGGSSGGWTKTPTGLEYKDEPAGTGAPVSSGADAVVDIVAKLPNGTVIYDTSQNIPVIVRLGTEQTLPPIVCKGVKEGLAGMRVGGTRKLIIPATLAFGTDKFSDPSLKVEIPANSTIYCDLQLKDWKASASGMRYTDTTAGTGSTIEPGDHAVTNIKVTLQDGKVVYQTAQSTPDKFYFGPGTEASTNKIVCKGLKEEGLTGMKTGGQRRLIIGPDQAFGSTGLSYYNIPANATLIYDVKLQDAQHQSDSGLQYSDVTIGTGDSITTGDKPLIGMIVKLESSGKQVYSGVPADFTYGSTGTFPDFVCKGVLEGLATMKVGGRRKLTIPRSLHYEQDLTSYGVVQADTLTCELWLIGLDMTVQEEQVTLSGKQYKLRYIDTQVGTGEQPQSKSKVKITYTGNLPSGLEFDSSSKHDPAYLEFVTDTNAVVAGMNAGVKSMKVGGKRKLIIPPALGYGNTANGSIPANSTMIFDVELIGSLPPQ